MPTLKITYTGDRRYTVSIHNNQIVSRYELLKSRSQARLKAVYFGVRSMPDAQAMARELTLLFGCCVEIRTAQRCSTNLEVVLRQPRVAQMPDVEKFVFTLIGSVQPARVVPLFHRPDQPRPVLATGSDGRRLNIS